MPKRRTISQRWAIWTKEEALWAYSALACFALAMLGLTIHLGVSGFWSGVGLWMLIGFDCGLLFITAYRKIWWWFTFWCYITIGVIGWEIASYFFGSRL